MYAFLFDRKSLALLVLGALVLGGLLFFAGFLVGLENGFPSVTAQVAAAPAALTPPAFQKAPEEDAATGDPSAATGDPDALPAEDPDGLEPEGTDAAVDLDEGGWEAGDPPPAGELPAVEAPPLSEPEPAPAFEEPAASAEPAAVAVGSGYALQVGAFRQKSNCDTVVADLAGRGYEPYVVEIRTPRRRILHAVRIGRFAGRAEAAEAASVFEKRERMAALVLPAS